MAHVQHRPASQLVEGFKVPAMFPTVNVLSAIHYKPRPDDVFIVTYPKCGTTWTQHILTLIFRKGIPLTSGIESFAASPLLEATGADAADTMPRPGCIKIHLPFHLTPYSKEAKYIYVTRNPKDCCVSFFHHMKNIPAHQFEGSFDEFFELFISGEIDFGDFFDHLLGWYEHRNDPNVLFVTYEGMKADAKAAVLKIAAFVGEEYSKLLKDDSQVLENIIRYSSFEYMKKSVNEDFDEMSNMDPKTIQNDPSLSKGMKDLFLKMKQVNKQKQEQNISTNFVRKGIVGDWRNYFNPEQSKRLEEKLRERLAGTELLSYFETYLH